MSSPLRTCWGMALVAALLGLSAWPASALGAQVRVRADPDRVPADGRSTVVVTVEVVDALGAPARDGTVVQVVATLGQVVSPVQTIGGLAQTVLTAPSAAGTALVSAIVGGTRESIVVEFLAEPGSAAPGSQVVELTAEEVSYSADHRMFVATWQAELRYREMEIRADGIQYDMGPNVVCAQGNVVLRGGGRTLSCDALRYELISLRGRLLRLDEEPVRLVVEGEKLETRPDPSEKQALWEPMPTGETRTWVRARRAVIDPGQKVILDHATFYVDETRVMSLRRHVLDPSLGGAVFGQALAFSSASGVSLDLPLYYRAGAHHVGSLHVTRNRALGTTRIGPGWSLGLREEYIRRGRAQGAFELDDLLHPEQGMGWQHRHQFGGGTSLNLDARSLRFDEEGPRLRTGSISFFHPTSQGRASLLVSRSDFGTSEHSLGEVAYRFTSLRTGSGVLVTPSLHVRQSRTYSEAETVVFDPDTGEPMVIAQQGASRTTSPGVEVSFGLPGRELGSDLRLTAGLTTGYAWGLAGGSRGVVDGRLRLDRSFAAGSSASLGFTYSSASAGLQTSLFQSGRRLLTLSGQTILRGTAVRMSASQDVGAERRFGSAYVSRPLPFGSDVLGRPLWRLSLSHVFSRLEAYSAANTRVALSRALGRYQISLCYSPQGVGEFSSQPVLGALGYGYTYSGGRHFWLELRAREY